MKTNKASGSQILLYKVIDIIISLFIKKDPLPQSEPSCWSEGHLRHDVLSDGAAEAV